MRDGLIYRFPGEPVQAFTGNWQKHLFSELKSVSDAFVVSNAEGSEVLVFADVELCALESFPVTLNQSKETPVFTKADYLQSLNALLDEMNQQELNKVVFSRIDAVSAEVDVLDVIKQLDAAYPQTLIYYIQSTEWGCWLGATPEILLQQVGEEAFRTMALAGTLPAESVEAKWTDKEIKEQEYVVEYITDVIEAFGSMIDITARKEVLAGPVKHLRTDFVLHLAAYNVPSFIQRIHPTPAVCGMPKQEAEACYKKFEPHQRKVYTGFLGRWSSQNLNLFVNLRCMACYTDRVDLYVGGGITPDSQPEQEWDETVRKAQTLKQFLTIR